MTLSRTTIRATAALAALGAGLFASASAHAYDLYGWRGFYVGAAGTYEFINQDVKFRVPNTATGSVSLDGPAGTGIVGYRIPFFSNDWRIGIEADVAEGEVFFAAHGIGQIFR